MLLGLLGTLLCLGAGQAQGADAAGDMMAKLALHEDCIVESPSLASNAAAAERNCAPRLEEALALLHTDSVADVRAQMTRAVRSFLDDNEVVRQRIYRLSADPPEAPAGGAAAENHVPAGWRATAPDATATMGVFSAGRNVFRSGGAFAFATAWGAVERIKVTKRSQTIYRHVVGNNPPAPATPTGGQDTEDQVPSGWSTTRPALAGPGAMFRSTRTVTHHNGRFHSATAWGSVTNYATARRQFIYRLAPSMPATPTGGQGSENHVPGGWSTTQPNPTATQGVYRAARHPLYRNNATFLLSSPWGGVTQIAAPTTTGSGTHRFLVSNHRPPTPPNGAGGYAFHRSPQAYSLSAEERAASNVRDEIPTWGELHGNATGMAVAVTDRNGASRIAAHRAVAAALAAGSTVHLTYAMSGRELKFRVSSVMLSGNNLRCNIRFAAEGRTRNAAAAAAASIPIVDGSATVVMTASAGDD